MPTERPDTPAAAGEREMLRGYLDFHRATLAMKCDGLSDDDVRRESMPPSTLSLLGLVRHLTEVERGWFRHTIGGDHDLPPAEDGTVADDAGTATREEVFAAWEAEVGCSRRTEAQTESLDVTVVVDGRDEDVSLRMIMLHMIQEYARHNGHADLLREGLDGVTGV